MWDDADDSLPPLPYAYDALEPNLSQKVVEWHHSRHQGAEAAACSRAATRRQQVTCASGAILHRLYWHSARAHGRRRPPPMLLTAIERDFGSFEAWVEDFIATAAVPRAGWALLVLDPSAQRLCNLAVEGHDEGALWGGRVLLACDVWEHAYYGQYGPYRGEYVRAFLDIVDWEIIANRLLECRLPRRPGAHSPRPLALPFSYHALRGVSAQSVQWMHGTHYAACARVAREVEQKLASLTGRNPMEFAALKRRERYYRAGQTLYELFWTVLGGGGMRPGGELLAAMEAAYGSFEGWRDDLLAVATEVEVGWVLLVWDSEYGRLRNLPVDQHHLGALWQSAPLLPLNLWEHAYYYDRGPNRASYLAALLDNVDWGHVETLFTDR